MQADTKVSLFVPCYGQVWMGCLGSIMRCSAGNIAPTLIGEENSFLTYCFNKGYYSALKLYRDGGPTYFCMLHSDIAVNCDGWLEKMLDMLEEHKADVVGVHMPIKNLLGLTSTAIDTDAWRPKRLTMHDIFDAPETFDGDYAKERWGGNLLLNTGCWVAKLDKPWCDKVCFDVRNRVVEQPDGGFECQAEPEDWAFSRFLHRYDAKLVVTRTIAATHFGTFGFTNHSAWGHHKTDDINNLYRSYAPEVHGTVVRMPNDPSLVYTAQFFDVHKDWKPDYDAIGDWVFDNCGGATATAVVDYGCGNAFVLGRIKERKPDCTVVGYDGSENAVQTAHTEKRTYVVHADLRQGISNPGNEITICTEVGEHLEAEHADKLVKTLVDSTTHDGTIFFSAALPGQPGIHHVNCQPQTYWIEKFASHGWKLDETRTHAFKETVGPKLKNTPWFNDTVMVFGHA